MTTTGSADPPATDGLLDAARAGDVRAFTTLLKAHDAAMRALVWSMVRDSWLMDDVLQQAYERAWKALPGFRGEAAFGTWLHRICWTTAVDALRAEGRRRTVGWPDPGPDDPAATDPGPEARVVQALTFDAAWRALPADQRTALTLVAGEGLPYAEAARICDTTEGTIAARVSRGRAKLRTLLAGADQPGSQEGPR
ncbi:MAG: RNA polymerase sigma factor [Kineosporiaceae bacterium]